MQGGAEGRQEAEDALSGSFSLPAAISKTHSNNGRSIMLLGLVAFWAIKRTSSIFFRVES
jgi:hypothetical protein